MVLNPFRRGLYGSSSRDPSPAPSSYSATYSAPPSRPTTPLNLSNTKPLSRSSSRSSMFSRTPKEPKEQLISPYFVRAPVAPTADMSIVTVHAGAMTFQHPRALLEFGSSTIKKELLGEGIAHDLGIEMPQCLEPSAVKAALEIVVSKTGGWELNIKAPATRVSPATSKRKNQNWSSSSASSRSTKSSNSNSSSSSRSASDKEASLWYIQLFEVGRYLKSEAVQNIAVSGYRRGRRSLSVRSNIYRDVDYLNERELWATKLGEFVVAMLAFEAKCEDDLPEWIEQLLEDAPYETFEAVKKQWQIVAYMQAKATAGWEDWVDPCVAMGCVWHEHRETRTCVEEEEKMRWKVMVDSLSAPAKGRAARLEKMRY